MASSRQASQELATRLVRDDIRALSAYHVPPATGMIKLDAMENPYPLPEELVRDWSRLAARQQFNRYPDPHASELAAAIRGQAGIGDDLGLLFGNGSDEIIQMLALALARPGASLLSVEPGFVMYRMIAGFCGLDYQGVSLRASDFALDMPALLDAIQRHRPALIFLAYPNNPTGNLFAETELLQIVQAAPGLVVVDEAYEPFASRTFMPFLGQFPNLLVMRTLSKFGLAGLRVGYLAGPRSFIDELDKLRLPYNLNVLSQQAALCALRHAPLFAEQARLIRASRTQLQRDLATLPGFQVFASEANFLLCRTAPGQAEVIFDGLLEAGVLIKKLHGSHPLLTDCLRITVGTPQENQALLAALQGLF